jgi:hypothetical protein
MLGEPRSGSKVWEGLKREIGKPGENRGQVVAPWEFQPAAAFHDRENRRNLRSGLWADDVQPILSTMAISVLKLKPRLWQNSLRRIPLLTNSATNC